MDGPEPGGIQVDAERRQPPLEPAPLAGAPGRSDPPIRPGVTSYTPSAKRNPRSSTDHPGLSLRRKLAIQIDPLPVCSRPGIPSLEFLELPEGRSPSPDRGGRFPYSPEVALGGDLMLRLGDLVPLLVDLGPPIQIHDPGRHKGIT